MVMKKLLTKCAGNIRVLQHTLMNKQQDSTITKGITIELPEGNKVVPLRSDTIRLVQNGCSFHGLRSEDPSQHLKDFPKLVDSLDLDGENRERMRLRYFYVPYSDSASNWLLNALYQQDPSPHIPRHGIDLWLQVQIFYNHVNPITRRTIDQSVGGKLRNLNPEESWAILEDLALYDNESWNDPRDFAKLVKAIALPQDVSSTSDRRLKSSPTLDGSSSCSDTIYPISSARAFTKLKIRKRNPSIAYSQRHHISNPKPVQRIQVDEPEIEQEEDNPVDTPQPQPNQFASIVTEQDDDEPKNESPSDGEGTTMEGPTVEYFDMFQLEMSYYIST
ncbi:hypothetical protein Tco_1502828 [Tanacetum coccineum]